MCWPWSKNKKKKDDLTLQEKETTVGLDGGKPTLLSRKRYKKQDHESIIKQEDRAKPIVIEKKLKIKPLKYEMIFLGSLKRGSTVHIEGKEEFGDNFTLFVMNFINLQVYRKDGSTKGSILSSNDEPTVDEMIPIQRTDEYYLVVTSRAIEKTRNIWVRIEIQGN